MTVLNTFSVECNLTKNLMHMHIRKTVYNNKKCPVPNSLLV